MLTKYVVRLSDEERSELEKLISSGSSPARKLNHARILLKADAEGPNWSNEKIEEALEICKSTIDRVRATFVEFELEVALNRKRPYKTLPRKLDNVNNG